MVGITTSEEALAEYVSENLSIGIIASGEALAKYVSENLSIGKIDDFGGGGVLTLGISLCKPDHRAWGI